MKKARIESEFNTLGSKNGLLVMHYGTPASLEDVEAYYTHIRRGNPPPADLLQDLVSRYKAIGGPSPLTQISVDQALLIQKGLHKRGVDSCLYIGTKHTTPFIADAVREMAEDGIEKAIGIVLAPHFSTYSIAAYKKYAFEARDKHAPEMDIKIIERWGMMPEFLTALAERVQKQLEGWNPQETLVIFSAHSLPEKIMATGDPYCDELMDTSKAVAEMISLPNWCFAFQSASQTGDPWLGPDILDVIEEKSKDGYKNVIACTVGFVSDHLEVLFDLGVEARDKCAELGLNFRRAECINTDERVMDALGALVVDHSTFAIRN